MSLPDAAWILGGGVLAGMLNALVGGGTFISFPALMFAGISPVSANATNTFALWPSGAASAVAYRRDFAQSRSLILVFSCASLAGGAVGGLLLLHTSERLFARLVPWLLLFATAVFTLGPRLRAQDEKSVRTTAAPAVMVAWGMVQLAVSIYGGYFGGGMGIMMLAAWSLLGLGNIHAMNALRSLLSALINGAAAVAFIASGVIAWRAGILMAVSATAAGYFGAAWARKLDPKRVRLAVVAIAWGITLYFFARTYAPAGIAGIRFAIG
jgi:uncharacterized protein